MRPNSDDLHEPGNRIEADGLGDIQVLYDVHASLGLFHGGHKRLGATKP